MNDVVIELKKNNFSFQIFDDGSMRIEFDDDISCFTRLSLDSDFVDVLRNQLNLWHSVAYSGKEVV